MPQTSAGAKTYVCVVGARPGCTPDGSSTPSRCSCFLTFGKNMLIYYFVRRHINRNGYCGRSTSIRRGVSTTNTWNLMFGSTGCSDKENAGTLPCRRTSRLHIIGHGNVTTEHMLHIHFLVAGLQLSNPPACASTVSC